MKGVWSAVAGLLLLSAMAVAQDGTVNYLSVNPRQNQELTNSTGTETGQPSPAVPGSENLPNGLIPVTTTMTGSGSNGNVNQRETAAKPASTQSKTSAKNSRHNSATAKAEKPPFPK